MAGRMSQQKGDRGQREARDVLTEYGWEVIETVKGRNCEDFICRDPRGVLTSVEVKHCEGITPRPWWKQAREQARKHRPKLPWLLMIRWPEEPYTFVVQGSSVDVGIWRGNEARKRRAS